MSDSLANRLHAARLSCGFTVDYVARMVDVKPREVERWERGDSDPSEKELSLLARLYGVDPNELTGGAPRGSDRSDQSARSDRSDRSNREEDRRDRRDRTAADGSDRFKSEVPPPRRATDTGDGAFFAKHLTEGERILWTGRPDPAHDSVRIPFPTRIFMIFWLGFAVFWTVTATSAGGLFGLFGVPFVLIGLYMNFGYRITGRKRKEGIRYAITDRRVLIASDGRDPFFHNFAVTPYLSIFCHSGRDGYGTVYLGADPAFDHHGHPFREERNTMPQGPDPRVHLVDVKDAEAVCRLLEEIAHGGDA